ncbi:MAG TPA: PH domain-containing protein [Streptosporangiaceae bacterium]
MSTVEPGTASGRQVFRTPGSVVLWWAWLVVAVLILGSVALRGHNHAGAVTALVVLAITGCMYACAWQPRIVTDADGITVQNPLRWHLLPWPLVTSVELVQTVEVHYTAAPGESRDKKVHSWAVQSSAASRTRAELRAKRNARTTARLSPRSAPRSSSGSGQTGYGQQTDAATAARQGSAAEFILRQLREKVDAAHRQAAAATADQAPPPAAAPGQRAEVRWAWWQIAAIAVPVLVLIAVALL